MTKKIFADLADAVLNLPRPTKRFLAILTDIISCVLSVYVAFYLRLGEYEGSGARYTPVIIISIFLAIPIFTVSGLYRAIFRYNDSAARATLLMTMALYSLPFAVIVMIIEIPGVPRTIGVIQPLILLLMVGSTRGLLSYWLGGKYKSLIERVNALSVLIYSAEADGLQLYNALSGSPEIRVEGFVDENKQLHGQLLVGKPVFSHEHLKVIVKKNNIKAILFPTPFIRESQRTQILKTIQETGVSVRVLPSMVDLAGGHLTLSKLREIEVQDLLGREPTVPNNILLENAINNNTVLVTGAGGSIGSEICRQVINFKPRTLILLEQSEVALYSIHQALERTASNVKITLVPILVSITQERRLIEIMDFWRPNVIYHAAAYKHVPLIEVNFIAGIYNNVFGTLRLAESAIHCAVSNFVLISTDKAVQPRNVMGVSKRLAELVIQALASIQSDTKFSIVRFGNVLGSSGSVIPKFRQQIKSGGPVTVTHPEVSRYFMTIPEAAQLVIQAGSIAENGSVFFLEMGSPVKIIDLAKKMIHLSGLNIRGECSPDEGIEIQITGLRPGEKLHEELFSTGMPIPTVHPRIFRIDVDFHPWSDLRGLLQKLELLLDNNQIEECLGLVKSIVKDYQLDDLEVKCEKIELVETQPS